MKTNKDERILAIWEGMFDVSILLVFKVKDNEYVGQFNI